jgi:hypothetical protein
LRTTVLNAQESELGEPLLQQQRFEGFLKILKTLGGQKREREKATSNQQHW